MKQINIKEVDNQHHNNNSQPSIAEKNNHNPYYLKPKDIAQFLNISQSQVYALINSGKLKASNFGLGGKNAYRITQEKLDTFIENSNYSSNIQQATMSNNKINTDSHFQVNKSNSTVKINSKQSILEKLESAK